MARDDEDRPTSKAAHEIGQDLSMLSAHELQARVAVLRGEIKRLEAAIEAKSASRAAAASFFKS